MKAGLKSHRQFELFLSLKKLRGSQKPGKFGGIWSEVSSHVASEAADLTTGLPLDNKYDFV